VHPGQPFFPLRVEHEVVDDELSATFKQIAECPLAVWAVEDVILFNFYHRQSSPFGPKTIELPGDLLFALQMLLASNEPFVLCNDFRMGNGSVRHDEVLSVFLLSISLI
jgi:hypothetical protein